MKKLGVPDTSLSSALATSWLTRRLSRREFGRAAALLAAGSALQF